MKQTEKEEGTERTTGIPPKIILVQDGNCYELSVKDWEREGKVSVTEDGRFYELGLIDWLNKTFEKYKKTEMAWERRDLAWQHMSKLKRIKLALQLKCLEDMDPEWATPYIHNIVTGERVHWVP